MLVAKIFWVDSQTPGRIGIMARPRGGDWLEDEIQALRAADVDVVVSLLTDYELFELELMDEAELCRLHGLEYVSLPIVDRAVPASIAPVMRCLEWVAVDVAAGKQVVVHCRMGIGRASLVAACVLVLLGMPADHAFDLLATARGCPVPDTPEQRFWVQGFADNLK